jgi:hypothetical protein
MKIIYRIFAVFIINIFVISTNTFAITSNSKTIPQSTQFSSVGMDSIDWLGSCVDQTGRLDVLMLIDSSASLQSTDPNNLRADIFASAVAKLYSLSKEAEIRIQVSTWAHDYNVLEDWTNLNEFESKSLGTFINSVRTGIANANDGKATDWRLAIDKAKTELGKQKQLNPKNCQTVFWFTDGGISTPITDSTGNYLRDATVEEINALDTNSIGQLCGTDSISTEIYQDALIPSLKTLGVTVLGVLLKVNPDAATLALMTYFPPLVEGSGIVDSSILGGAGSSSLKCLNPSGENPAGGVSIEATSADALNQAIDSILCTLKNCVNANPLNVDASVGFFEIEVSTSNQNFDLLGPSGAVIRNGQTIPEWSQNISVVQIPSGYFIRVKTNEQSLGLWTMQTSEGKALIQPNDWSSRVYSGIDIQVDKSTLVSSDEQEIKGKITQNGELNNLSDFQSGWKLTGTHKNKNKSEEIQVRDNGEFTWKISTTGSEDKAQLNFELAGLISNTSHTGANPTNYNYPNVKSSISMTIFGDTFPTLQPLNPEISLFGNTTESVLLASNLPKSGSGGEICLGQISNNDPALKIDYENRCYAPAENIEISFTGPRTNGKDLYLSSIPVSFKNSMGETVELEIEPKVFWAPPLNVGKFGLWVLILTLLGIAGPLALLVLLNAQSSKLHLKNLSRAQIPVLINKSSDLISVQRLEEDGEQISKVQGFQYEDYQSLPTSLDRERNYQSIFEQLKGLYPLNPFGNITAAASVASGASIISNIPVGPRDKNGTLTSATVNPNKLILLSLDNISLSQILKPDPNFKGLIKGTLISYSNLFMGEPNSIIEQTNQDLQIGNSWMSGLLQIELPKVENVKLPENENKIEDTSWGNTSSSDANTSDQPNSDTTWGQTSSDWGSSNSDDWGSDPGKDSGAWR